MYLRILIFILSVNLVSSASFGEYFSRKKAGTMFQGLLQSKSGFTSSSTSFLKVADLKRDGKTKRTYYLPTVHPLVQMKFNLFTSYYSEEFQVSYSVNKQTLIRANLKNMYEKRPDSLKRVPLSIPGSMRK